jgi:hypothetical protein
MIAVCIEELLTADMTDHFTVGLGEAQFEKQQT